MEKRKLEIVVLSDIHLGTYGCHAEELCEYLQSIDPEILVLNGDVIDIWQYSKDYWPDSHMRVVEEFVEMMTKGKIIYYIPGNHDELLRRFANLRIGNFKLVKKVLLKLKNNKKAWIFHGDVFDVTMRYSKWLAKLGALGYDILVIINRFINDILHKLGRERISLAQKIKVNWKKAVKYIKNFEQIAIDIALKNQFDYVICGHIHYPDIREYVSKKGEKVTYLNSGDWIENLTALEYKNEEWKIFRFEEKNK